MPGTYEKAIKIFEIFSDKRASDATPEDLLAWKSHLIERGLQTSSVRSYLYAVIKTRPDLKVEMPKAPKDKIRVELTMSELKRVFEAIPLDTRGFHDMAIIAGLLSGISIQGIRSLRWCDKSKIPAELWKIICWQYELADIPPSFGSYIFTARNEAWKNLPGVTQDLTLGVTGTEMNRRLRKYAHRTGVERKKISVRNLRIAGTRIMRSRHLSVDELIRLFLPKDKEIETAFRDKARINAVKKH